MKNQQVVVLKRVRDFFGKSKRGEDAHSEPKSGYNLRILPHFGFHVLPKRLFSKKKHLGTMFKILRVIK